MQATLQEYKDRATKNYIIHQNKKFYGLEKGNERTRDQTQRSLDSPRNPIMEAFDKAEQQQQ